MDYQFLTADVFTHQIFGGNQLAVFPNAEGLNSQQMQQIAAEFNFSETVFVFPSQDGIHYGNLRIFTPKSEIPFAGHPTVGTAYVLAAIGNIPLTGEITKVLFQEGIGTIPVKIRCENDLPVYTELTSAQLPEFGPPPPSISELASMLSLQVSDFLTGDDSPQGVSCGLPFLFIPLRNRRALKMAQLNRDIWQNLLSSYWSPHVYLFCYDPELEGSHLRARMFAPALGVDEDPATGSAATALAGYLGIRHQGNGTLSWVIEQGFEMGRASLIQVEADVDHGNITEIRVGGASVIVSQGVMKIPDF